MAGSAQPKLGERLRELRERQKISLREMERRSGINSGYLSQLERNEIAQPTPSVLNRLAAHYGEPVSVLMEWAGYIETDPEGLSPNRKRALNYIPEDISDDELEALRAVLQALRGRDNSATAYGKVHRSDLQLPRETKSVIRQTAVALLRELDADQTPAAVNLDDALALSKLVAAQEIELDLEQRQSLRQRFGALVDRVLTRLQGVINLDSGEVFVKTDLHELKRRFVLGHEIGHGVLEDHRIVFAHLDDHKRLEPEFADELECQANHFSIELLAKGDLLRKEFDGSRPRARELARVSNQFEISVQAAARRIAEESQQECAVAIAWRANSGRGQIYLPSCKVWTSQSFERRYRWRDGEAPKDQITAALLSVGTEGVAQPFSVFDSRGGDRARALRSTRKSSVMTS